MNVERMRRQRGKHHDLRYHVWHYNRDDLLHMGQDGWAWCMEEMKDCFRMEVLRWNMWRKAPLSDMTVEMQYNIDFHQDKVIFEIRRLREAHIKEFW